MGQVPAQFYIELTLRCLFVYILLVISLRLMGKRMSSQLGRSEMTALVSLAAAIGIPLQSPERGILPAIVIAFVVVYLERWLSAKAFGNQNFEKLAQGNIGMLIKNSVIDMNVMLESRLTPQRINAQLRSQGIKQLGEVRRFYIEANGSFTLLKNDNPGPGLSVVPEWDKEYYDRQKKSDDMVTCGNCGLLRKKDENLDTDCSNCGKRIWKPAAVN